MPTYEYACDKCEHEFEREQRITDDPVKTCPACRSRKVRRLISSTSFVLKGSGWYSDLYSSAKPEKEKKKSDGEGASSKTSGSDAKGSDSKASSPKESKTKGAKSSKKAAS